MKDLILDYMLVLRDYLRYLLLMLCATAHTHPACILSGEREQRPALKQHRFMGEPRHSSDRSLPIRQT